MFVRARRFYAAHALNRTLRVVRVLAHSHCEFCGQMWMTDNLGALTAVSVLSLASADVLRVVSCRLGGENVSAFRCPWSKTALARLRKVAFLLVVIEDVPVRSKTFCCLDHRRQQTASISLSLIAGVVWMRLHAAYMDSKCLCKCIWRQHGATSSGRCCACSSSRRRCWLSSPTCSSVSSRCDHFPQRAAVIPLHLLQYVVLFGGADERMTVLLPC